jgi:two-component system, OmpR family, sensor histidine kinase BaeS
MKIKLKTILSITFGLFAVGLTAVLLVVANITLDQQFRQYTLKQQEQLHLDFVEMIKEQAIADHLSHEYLLTVGELALKQGMILMYNNAQGDQLFCMSCIDDESCTSMIEDMEHTMLSIYPDFDGEYLEQSYPIVIDQVSYGTVSLGYYGPFYYNDQDINFINTLNQVFLISAIVFLGLAVLLGYLLAELLVLPLQAVINKTQAIAHGDYSQRITLNTNTTEINQLIGEVNYLAAKLQQQYDDQLRLAHDYTHEIRTPLATLQLQLEGMIDGVLPTTNERLESCRQEILRLGRMVSGIDKLVQIETIKEPLNYSSYQLSDQIRTLLPGFEKQLMDQHLSITTDLTDVMIMADYDKLSQVLINLLSNAIKYSKPNGIISIKTMKQGNEVEITVSDQGIGIAPLDLPHIFEYLYRADPSRNRYTGGSGIGLAIVKAYIQAHQGRITVKSNLNQGTTFIINLPIKVV